MTTTFGTPGDEPMGPRVSIHSDTYAPVRIDPVTGQRETWTRARFVAAGYDVRDCGVAYPDLWLVDLDSQKKALPPPVDPPAWQE